MPTPLALPLVFIASCHQTIGNRPFLMARCEYIEAVRWAGCLPLIATGGEADDLLDYADGILLTGSPANVHPSHYGEEVLDPTLPLDPLRDSWTLPLIRRAIQRGVPLMGICRGHQEINVALGGSLHQAIHAVPGFNDHREPDTDDQAVRFAVAHEIDVVHGGRLDAILGQSRIPVNSAHGQGIHRLAEGLRVEARSPDGVIEAVTMPEAPGFNLGTQWHPEWQAAANPASQRIFKAFGDACRERRSGRPR
ncbi:gamma-glutamyl-gamma-aminobutyrate hydrolase family protein [Luteolibacter arcticus]|uniref:Gamma-glutamyl-gamma-aminobutyrate hydrolase family protein n=1 Tax=Luteolibacter arcticus TaxID=1581411 RepID=A0ABT3GI70_9BACT|nr:gamma-glutamyl-gamma-aminobutyrate hydrolase family protein [Luteolibacter arcticus]MCW1923189.1 gamma-glutamyl-gamma-aminobutyrate hydrolase family protein [Luteolibacter arcticus]